MEKGEREGWREKRRQRQRQRRGDRDRDREEEIETETEKRRQRQRQRRIMNTSTILFRRAFAAAHSPRGEATKRDAADRPRSVTSEAGKGGVWSSSAAPPRREWDSGDTTTAAA